MSEILKRLLVASCAGLVVGIWVAATTVSFYEAPVDLEQTLAEQEVARGRANLQFTATVFLITLAVVAVPVFFVGNLRLPASAWPVVLGALVGVVTVFAAAHVEAYARNEWPFHGKSPTTSVDWARTVGIPLGALAGGTVGYLAWLRRTRLRESQARGVKSLCGTRPL